MTKGKDLQTQGVSINLKNKMYKLNFDLNAMAELEDKYGTLNKAIGELKQKKMSAVRAFLYAVLKSSDESLSEFDVGRLIDMNNFSVIETAITKLINNSFVEDDKEDDKDGETNEVKNEQTDHQE